MPTLYRVRRGTSCGPAALAAITGREARYLEDLINERRKRPAGTRVVGTWWEDLRYVLRNLGYVVNVVRLPSVKKPLTLEKIAGRLGWSSTYLIECKRHFMAVRDGIVVDTHAPAGAPLATHRYRRDHIVKVAIVHRPKRRTVS